MKLLSPLRSTVFGKAQYCVILMGILSSVWTANVLASKLYRYKNSEGNIVIDHRIPFEYMAKGYEILTSDGRLIEVVSPQTEDDSVDQKDDAVAAKARAREDKFILSSYSTVEEIDQAKKRKLTQLDREINLVKSNLADTRKQREQEQVRAADYQRGGKAVPEAIRKVLVELDIQEGKAEKSLASREKEIVAVNTLYTRYKKRYIKLTEPPSKSLTEIRAESELNGSSE